jgi:hypothetical protein
VVRDASLLASPVAPVVRCLGGALRRDCGPIVAVLNEQRCQEGPRRDFAGQGGGGALPGSFVRHTSHHAVMPQRATG